MNNPGDTFLLWPRTCVTYTFNAQLFERMPLLGEAATRDIFNASYATWAAVDCGGRQPFLVEQAAGTTATSAVEFSYNVQNESIVVVRTAEEWLNQPDHDPSAVAITQLFHNKRTGEILDVDMELNGGSGKFADCVKTRCTGSMVDLQNTITHEGGHLLGLGHSDVPGSTMNPATSSVGETRKRVLAADDKEGYCALELPEWTCSGASCMCPAPPIYRKDKSSCGCQVPGQPGRAAPWLSLISLFLGAVLVQRLRR